MVKITQNTGLDCALNLDAGTKNVFIVKSENLNEILISSKGKWTVNNIIEV